MRHLRIFLSLLQFKILCQSIHFHVQPVDLCALLTLNCNQILVVFQLTFKHFNFLPTFSHRIFSFWVLQHETVSLLVQTFNLLIQLLDQLRADRDIWKALVRLILSRNIKSHKKPQTDQLALERKQDFQVLTYGIFVELTTDLYFLNPSKGCDEGQLLVTKLEIRDKSSLLTATLLICVIATSSCNKAKFSLRSVCKNHLDAITFERESYLTTLSTNSNNSATKKHQNYYSLENWTTFAKTAILKYGWVFSQAID